METALDEGESRHTGADLPGTTSPEAAALSSGAENGVSGVGLQAFTITWPSQCVFTHWSCGNPGVPA